MVGAVLLKVQMVGFVMVLDSCFTAGAPVHVDVNVHLVLALDVPVSLAKVARVVGSSTAKLLSILEKVVVEGIGGCKGLLESEAQLDMSSRSSSDEESEGLEVHICGRGLLDLFTGDG